MASASVLVLEQPRALRDAPETGSVLEARGLPRPRADVTMVASKADVARIVRESAAEATQLVARLESSGILPPLASSEDSSDGEDEVKMMDSKPSCQDRIGAYFRGEAGSAVYFLALRCCERLQEDRPDVTLGEVCFRLARTLSAGMCVVREKKGQAPGKRDGMGSGVELIARCVAWARSKTIAKHKTPAEALSTLEALLATFSDN